MQDRRSQQVKLPPTAKHRKSFQLVLHVTYVCLDIKLQGFPRAINVRRKHSILCQQLKVCRSRPVINTPSRDVPFKDLQFDAVHRCIFFTEIYSNTTDSFDTQFR